MHDYLLDELLGIFKPCIQKQLKKVDKYYQEDLRQEIIYKIYKSIINFKIDVIKFNEETYNLELKKINEFIKIYNLYDKSKKIIFYEYQLFNQENQLKIYISKTCENTRISFYKKYIAKDENVDLINAEMVDEYSAYIMDEVLLEKLKSLKKEEYNFIFSLFNNKKKITLTEIAKKEGISIQAVSKRKKKILEKLKHAK